MMSHCIFVKFATYANNVLTLCLNVRLTFSNKLEGVKNFGQHNDYFEGFIFSFFS